MADVKSKHLSNNTATALDYGYTETATDMLRMRVTNEENLLDAIYNEDHLISKEMAHLGFKVECTVVRDPKENGIGGWMVEIRFVPLQSHKNLLSHRRLVQSYNFIMHGSLTKNHVEAYFRDAFSSFFARFSDVFGGVFRMSDTFDLGRLLETFERYEKLDPAKPGVEFYRKGTYRVS